jgi:hypothetical protein
MDDVSQLFELDQIPHGLDSRTPALAAPGGFAYRVAFK